MKKNTLDGCVKLAGIRGGQCMHDKEPDRREKILWLCREGHQFRARVDNVRAGGWCPVCAHRGKWTVERLGQVLEGRHIRCSSPAEALTNNKARLEWECDVGHTWKTALVNVVYRKSGCPECRYKAEGLCRDMVEEFFQAPFPRSRPFWLDGLELDGYCELGWIAFEYQGRQHYEEVPHFRVDSERLRAIQERDARKKKLCKENHVRVLVIRYFPRDCFSVSDFKSYVESQIVAQLMEMYEESASGGIEVTCAELAAVLMRNKSRRH